MSRNVGSIILVNTSPTISLPLVYNEGEDVEPKPKKTNSNNEFDNSQGDTGIRLQYTHCRLCSLEKNCGVPLPEICDPQVLHEPEAISLALEIARFDEILKKSYDELEACILVNYLFQLCNAINKAFKLLPVKNQDPHIGSQRLLLFHVARTVLNHGMNILGLKVLKEINAINKAFKLLPVKNQDPHIGSQRLLLFHVARTVLNHGMNILGLKVLKEM